MPYFKIILASIILLSLSNLQEVHSENFEDHNKFEEKILLGDLDSKDYHKLSAAEKAIKLRALAKKIDQDKNGKISKKELAVWTDKNHITDVVKRSKQFFQETDEDNDGFVSFAEYEDSQYNDPRAPQDYRNKTMYKHEQRRFQYADQDANEKLDLKEFIYFLNPEEGKHMLDCIVQETIENMDRDDDNLISVKDYMGERVLEMTEEEFKEDFRKFSKELDKNGDGFMDKDEMTEMIKRERQTTGSREAKHLFEHGDKDKDGQLSYNEIVAIGQILESSRVTQYGEQLKNIKPHKHEL